LTIPYELDPGMARESKAIMFSVTRALVLHTTMMSKFSEGMMENP
jgi:hypothetical protein